MVNAPNLEKLLKITKEHTVRTQPVTYDIGTIIRQIDDHKIRLDPEYQRKYRWDDVKSSRLIESLILNIPVPYIYLSNDVDIDDDMSDVDGYYSVIDGQQRLTSIRNYLNDEFPLRGLGIITDLEGKRFSELPDFLKRRINDRTINCLRIDSTVDETVKFDVFERLNTGSVQLTSQELRNSTYGGSFNRLLQELAKDDVFVKLTEFSKTRIDKMDDLEFILRFFALTGNRYQSYTPLMSTFLSTFMKKNQHANETAIENYRNQFLSAMRRIYKVLGEKAFAKKNPKGSNRIYASRFNAAVFDAVIVADDNIYRKDSSYNTEPRANFDKLFDNADFIAATRGSITDASALKTRVDLAEIALSK
jgi:hypothetical protein